MDFQPNEIQAQILDAAQSLLTRLAGPERARTVRATPSGVDDRLVAAVREAGFVEAFDEPEPGPLAVALVVEAVSRYAGCVPVIGPMLVGPAVLGRTDLTTLMVIDAERPALVRYAVPGPAVVLEGDTARLVDVPASAIESVVSPYGFAMARVTAPAGGDDLGPVAARVRSWWQVGLALEMSGAMREAMRLAVAHVLQRDQFGHPIGRFQAIQHRLAWAASMAEGARWLAYEAAWQRAEPGVAASAAGFAATAAARVMRDAHQVHGAMGFTVEADLQLWTMRLPVLRLEAGGVAEHRRIAGAEWLAGQPA